MGLILAGTGHRPHKLGGYGDDVQRALVKLASSMIKEHTPAGIISGMALGWDQALAQAAVEHGVPLLAAIPFKGQESRWPETSKRRYQVLLDAAKKVETVCEGGYAPWKMQKRNEWMVDKCDTVLALWDGSTGGTANCVKYAEQQGKPILNCWDNWLQQPELPELDSTL